jgi:DNA invertase Pin-like site-specific DNA recombinase
MLNNKKIPIIQELLNKGNSVIDIAISLRTSPQGVYYYINKYNLKRNVGKKTLDKKNKGSIIMK